MTTQDAEDRITELEIRLTHMEDTLDSLNRTVVNQDRLIDRLQMEISDMKGKLKAALDSGVASKSEEQPPPHY